MRFAIYGTGGVGGYFGGRLALAGNDVTFIARNEHLRAIQQTGLRVSSVDGDFVIHPAKATDDPQTVDAVDLIVVGVKAWQVPDAAEAMRPMVGTTTTVLPLQNGVEAPFQLAAKLGQEHVVGGLCKIVSYVVEPGHIRHAGFEPSVVIGELDNQSTPRIEKIRDAFSEAGVNIAIAPDINVALWSKFLFITSFSGVAALTGKTAGEVRGDSETRGMLKRAMEEVFELAQARGIRLPGTAVEKALESVDSLPAQGTSSMQRDIAAGRPSELESQTGAVVRLAREAGVSVPTHEMIYEALR
jgi:2-dehydropantoate 2-reductase